MRRVFFFLHTFMVFPERVQSISGARALRWGLMRVGSIPLCRPLFTLPGLLTHQPGEPVPHQILARVVIHKVAAIDCHIYFHFYL